MGANTMIACKTPKAKRILADHLKANDTDMLDMFQALGQKFGPADQVSYEGPDQDDLVAELKRMRDEAAADGIQQIRGLK